MSKKSVKPRQLKKKSTSENPLPVYTEIAKLKKVILDLGKDKETLETRTQELEIHMSLMIRLLTTLCIEKFGMRVGVLKRLIKQAEEEAIRDSQIIQLENWFQMSPRSKKDKPQNPPAPPETPGDPWENIS